VASQQSLYINHALIAAEEKPWRKVHLDFHNSQYMPSIGSAFDADEFGQTLVDAHINGIVVFAKDMHGYFYYPSEYGPVHPGLSFDLLGPQVEACRSKGIKVYAYYCVTWDNYLAERHPEWLVVKRDRSTYLPKFDETPGWTALCLTNEDYVSLLLDHSREILENYELDGIWYDMPLPIGGECYCRNCLAAIRAAGGDPFNLADQRTHKQQLLVGFMRRSYDLAQEIRPGCQVDQNNQTRIGLGERAPYMGGIDIEALPTGGWGYYYYPSHVRYTRNFGTPVYGMTGRFHLSWADFGGLKTPGQLETELRWIIAQGAMCDIGDQAPPDGRLDPAVYQTIGAAYATIEQLEPYLRLAAPVTEAAILVDGMPLDELASRSARETEYSRWGEAVYGYTRLLSELHMQFDIVETSTDWEKYRLIIVSERIDVSAELAARLNAFLERGGAVIAVGEGAIDPGSNDLWATTVKGRSDGVSPFEPAYLTLKAADGEFWQDVPDYQYALYDGSLQLLVEDQSIVTAGLGEPLFQRTPEHYTSHRQTPFDHESRYSSIVVKDSLGIFSFPVGSSYFSHGYWVYREAFRRVVDSVLPERAIVTDAPLAADVTLTWQAASDEHPERWLVHLVNFGPSRRGPGHLEYYEDVVPLHGTRVTLATDQSITRIYQASDGTPLNVEAVDNGVSTTVPRIDRGEIIVFEVE
jgi:hypothetical protein